jgi:hypothetical protein
MMPTEEEEFNTAAEHLFMTLTSSIQGQAKSRPLARDVVDGLVIDTCQTSDLGYETAIMDETGAHPVARYEIAGMALKGHAWWTRWAGEGHKTVTKLGYPGLTPDDEIRLVRMR